MPERWQDFSPTREKERIVLLDALRGFALFGVLIANLRDLSLHGLLPEAARNSLGTASWDHGIDLVLAALVDVKAFTIFTLLFGIGFAMQAERAQAAGVGLSRFGRRMFVLFVIGLVHACLFWWGDILRLYAVLGLFLLPLARVRARTLAILGILVAVFLTPFLRPVMNAILPDTVSSSRAAAAALQGFQSSSVSEMLRANFQYDLWTRLSAWGLPFYVLGRLLIGAALGRSGVLRDAHLHRRFWVRLLALTLPLGMALTAFFMLRDGGALGSVQGWWRTDLARGLIRIARSSGSLALGLAYVAAFVLLFQRSSWRAWMERLAPIGRMALTNYIMQTLLGIALFYGIGLGIGPRFGLVGVVIATLCIFPAQMIFSHWWLQRFHFGPLEWLWRTLTYGSRQPWQRR